MTYLNVRSIKTFKTWHPENNKLPAPTACFPGALVVLVDGLIYLSSIY